METIQHDIDAGAEEAAQEKDGTRKNFAKVGSARPPSLMYTYGPGALMDLPNMTVMPKGLESWKHHLDHMPVVDAPRLLSAVRTLMGSNVVKELRRHPWLPASSPKDREGARVGVPVEVFPQWLRCTGCDMLAPVTSFSYVNTNPYSPDKARFEHESCPGRTRRRGAPAGASPAKGKRKNRAATPARYLLACPNGHLDEFPYVAWAHQGGSCPQGAYAARLYMTEVPTPRGSSARIECRACHQSQLMRVAQGKQGEERLPMCRGRHPHLGTFQEGGCNAQVKLLLIGASNLWFPANTSIIAMPKDEQEKRQSLVDQMRTCDPEMVEFALGKADAADKVRRLVAELPDLRTLPDGELLAVAREAQKSDEEDEAEVRERQAKWDPIDLLVPEYAFLQRSIATEPQDDDFQRSQEEVPEGYRQHLAQVQKVEKLRKVNAMVGFTRIDDLERVEDRDTRLVPLTRNHPTWTVVTEDRGEGIYLQLSEQAVAAWEERIAPKGASLAEAHDLWRAHVAAYRLNASRRESETADRTGDLLDRMPPPRYWLVHTLSHVLLREMAMYAGYSAASLTERIYAWEGTETREPAAGVLISTTASDSDGTLGGLVSLSDPGVLGTLLDRALTRASRCSSDPICAQRTPRDPEDFLHGAACHNCSMASETSCERSNRFLDRRFLVDLPGGPGLGFFGARG
ncbi:DUF1998 domain-containing protein [Kytococcus sedentarius]|uniref:DUF1998 domain-containing protein n=1 Tax=Kytococcus sedentarius TaxID=1276 RepID=UPI00194EEB5B|nr:DUF1998 domain-containing protein [Kytococcus sedentarius]QRO87010.1 DUF1998 domain-containing protein [Kytococcus sedentarius]